MITFGCFGRSVQSLNGGPDILNLYRECCNCERRRTNTHLSLSVSWPSQIIPYHVLCIRNFSRLWLPVFHVKTNFVCPSDEEGHMSHWTTVPPDALMAQLVSTVDTEPEVVGSSSTESGIFFDVYRFPDHQFVSYHSGLRSPEKT